MSDKKGKTYQEYSKFLETNFTKTEVAKLIEVSSLDTFNAEMREILESFYDHPDGNVKRLGSIFNAIYTQHNNVFTLSVRMIHDLVRLDTERHGLKSCEGSSYNFIVHHCLIAGLFEKLREQVGKKAALYKLTHPKFLDPLKKVVSDEVLNAKEDKFIEWWDSTDSGEEKQARVLTAEQQKARDTANDIFNKRK